MIRFMCSINKWILCERCCFYGGFDSEINNMEKTAARCIKVEKLLIKEYLIKKIFQAQIFEVES